MTIAFLLRNTLQAARYHAELREHVRGPRGRVEAA